MTARFTGIKGVESPGFQFVIGTLGLPLEFEIEVEAVSDDGARTSLGRVRGRRKHLRPSYSPEIQPLLITTIGRSGTVWLTTQLSRCPEIIACQPFEYEAVLSSYWIEVLLNLAEPASYLQTILPEHYGGRWWIGDRRTTSLPQHLANGGMARWLGSENVETMARFCQQQVDRFCRELARREDRVMPRFCVG